MGSGGSQGGARACGMSFRTALRRPRTWLIAIPIIVISSRTAEKHRSRASALGVNAFIGKPFREAELLEHIRACLRRT